jgi:cytochrome c oxidase subunit III
VFYGLTWFHALHVAVGVLGLAYTAQRTYAGALNAARHQPLKLWAMFWHFVGIIWAILFVTIFVM